MAESIVYNQDCFEYMKTLPDNYFDLAVCDPPYGDALGGGNDPSAPLQFHGGDRWSKYLEHETQAPSKPIDHLHSSARKQEKAAQRARHAQGKNCRKPDGTWGYANWREEESSSTSATSAPVARTGGTWAEKYGKKIIAWDVAPEEEVFDEIFRVSKNQIIWGGNYFDLPPTRCFLVWRKLTISEAFSMAMAEYAWTSFNSNAKVFEAAPQGRPGDTRFHPTQKPIELYAWIYSQFTKPGDKVFDPFLGSGSSRIAAYNAGIDFVGCEIDEFYFKKQEERFEQQTAQMSFFTEQE